jgi:hypothetical protein
MGCGASGDFPSQLIMESGPKRRVRPSLPPPATPIAEEAKALIARMSEHPRILLALALPGRVAPSVWAEGDPLTL